VNGVNPKPTIKSSGSATHRVDPRAWLGLRYWRHGLWLPLCVCLLLLAALLTFDALSLSKQINGVASTASGAALPLRDPAALPVVADEQSISAFRQVLSPSRESTRQVRRLVELTRPELAWQRAQFQQSEDAALGIVQIQITVPVSGEYRQMRKALDRALLEMPNLSLDQVTFRRQQANESQLEARLRFSLWASSTRGSGSATEAKP
jgi:hypothetical protein